MKKEDTTIISYTDYRKEQVSSTSTKHGPITNTVPLDESDTNLNLKANLELPLTERIPILFNQWKKASLIKLCRRRDYIKQNLLRDFFLRSTFKYPFVGLFIILTHKVYWGQLLIFAACYLIIFLIIGVIYYTILVPTILAWAIVTLGPLGIIIVHIQWLLQTNALTALVCRNIVLTHINNKIFDITLYLLGQKEFLRCSKYIKVIPKQESAENWTTVEFWVFSVPTWTASLLRSIAIFIILTSISVIPLIGPTIVNQLISGRRGFSYMGRYFTLKGDNKAQAKDFEYEHLGLFLSFGMAAGLLELIPLLSFLTIASNTVGAARWSVELIKSS